MKKGHVLYVVSLCAITFNLFAPLTTFAQELPVALPTVETPPALDDGDAEGLRGDSDDPAIWVHPTDPRRSLVIAAQKNGGLLVFDLQGQIRQLIAPEEYGAFRYNNVDIVYNFYISGKRADIAVATDRANDTLAVFKIDPDARLVEDVTSASMPGSIFGLDDGTTTAYGLAAYQSPISGKSFVFVTQREGDKIAQMELTDDGAGRVVAQTVRTLFLPVVGGNPADSQSEGMVVDRETGVLYVATESSVGLFKALAEPDQSSALTLLHPIDAPFFQPDIEGLTIYYGPNGSGYLMVSSQGNDSFAVFSRGGNNEYLGSFAVGQNGPIDEANESDGADVVNVSLGPEFPFGLLVVQDGDNDPEVLVEDDGEIENISSNFKYVPWQNVANAFPVPLLFDPISANPRGTPAQQAAFLITDVRLLTAADELSPLNGKVLLAQLRLVELAIRRDANLAAYVQLLAFILHVHRLDATSAISHANATSLITYARSLATYLGRLQTR